jgi:hypothetical protein
MKLPLLAKIFELKYGLKTAASKDDILARVRAELVNAYNLYVNSHKAKEPVLQILADAKEPFSKKLVESFEEMIAGIHTLAAPSLFRRINGILGVIATMKQDPEKKVRNFIHDSVRVTKESERNYRERLKSKFEMIIARLSSILEKQAKTLQDLIGMQGPELQGGAVEPQRQELSKNKLLMFSRTPAAQKYGLDDLDTMTRLLNYPDLKNKITTLINAIDRGHVPADGPEVMTEAAELKRIYQERQATNIPALEEMPEKPAPAVSILGDES